MTGELQRFNPQSALSQFDSLRNIGNLLDMFDVMRPLRALADQHMRMDVTETDQAYLVKAEMPGIRKEDVDVSVRADEVTINAASQADQERTDGTVVFRERHQGSHYRSFTLPGVIDQDRATATLRDGVLELHLPKKGGNGVRQLPIQ
ncbi:Hsp20/alpha crystallin family protein [Massilia scottii]|uniref:Hsp20/alpha crystallin family protein n=1 Tax=Massilia scottii TaxID=3057166 RepID=UPI0027964C8D|nr:Hsp20/alpha crystallin family protein [Massilia sp. CCM 9029]MDQ1831647.1 Hsp20/alpha crystallin family protein [Massilia sp. CCM 9029]